MPGIKVEGGTVEAQGETVQKILVDGREFFGSDVGQAIKSLPAQIVKSVEVFDKLSDEAEFSGIDDGNSYKAINIVTHNKMKTAIFGKMDAQYAFEPRSYDKTQHYGSVNGSVNFFREKSKTTVRFRANNMNGNAQSKMGMAGVNYINAWGKDDKFRLITSNNRAPLIINLARITDCKLLEPVTSEEYRPKAMRKRKLVLELTDERNALERCMLHFSHLEKETERIDDWHYRLTLHYEKDDETELLIRVLSFGHVLKVISPDQFKEKLKNRITKQMQLRTQK
jgi:hypothetical protein